MKKLISLALCIVLAAALGLPAFADVIWVPEDEFLWTHYDECEDTEADYEACGDAVIQQTPEVGAEQGIVPAGETVRVYSLWEGWGYVDGEFGTGWVVLKEFRQLFGLAEFEKLCGDEVVHEEGEIALGDYEVVYVWAFPGSGDKAGAMYGADYSWSERNPEYSAVWTDKNGGRWGRLDYFYGMRGWICLDDPGAEEHDALFPRYADEIEEEEPDVPDEGTEEPVGETEEPSLEARPAAEAGALAFRKDVPAYDAIAPSMQGPGSASGRSVLVICLVVAVVAVAAVIAIVAVLEKKPPKD